LGPILFFYFYIKFWNSSLVWLFYKILNKHEWLYKQYRSKIYLVEISKISIYQKGENFIIYFTGQTQNELRGNSLNLLAGILNYFINIWKTIVNLIQKKETIRLTFEFRFIGFFRFVFYFKIFKNANTYSPNDLDYETSVCLPTRRFSRVGGFSSMLNLWVGLGPIFFLNFLEFILFLVGASLQIVAFFHPVDLHGLIPYKREVLTRFSKYWEGNTIFPPF
jgi:hypothetical protein